MTPGFHPQPRIARPLTLVATMGLIVTAVLGVAAHLVPDPGMSPLSLTISDYAVSDRGWLMNIAILTIGLTSLAVPLALRAARAPIGAATEVLLLVWCLGLTAAALVPTDPIGTVGLSTAGQVHRYVSVAAFVALPVATLLALRTLRADARWRGAVPALRALAVASVLGLLALYYVAFPGGRVMMGLVERVLVVVELALLAVLVARLYRVVARGPEPATPPVHRPGPVAQGAWGTVAGRPASVARGTPFADRQPPLVRGEWGRRAARW
ncbi:DUF998 domain-containing protein [Plantactinospora sp. CA-290183]|uniref:DUF998 domain-containing protein n=1 Tax=Plantactinospora sp. CA-290183 TaxID=3240006 RepID=UPI003D8CA1FD